MPNTPKQNSATFATHGNITARCEWFELTRTEARFALIRIVWRELLRPAFHNRALPEGGLERVQDAIGDYNYATPDGDAEGQHGLR